MGLLAMQVLFVPKAPAKYAAMIEFSARLPNEENPLPLMTMELKGEGRYPQLLFDRPMAFLPAVPVGVKSQTQFYILNDGCVLTHYLVGTSSASLQNNIQVKPGRVVLLLQV